MVKWRLALAMATVIPAAAHAKDREPEVLARTGQWIVNYDTDGCHLFGEFGSGTAKVTARFTWYDLGGRFDLSLYGERFRKPRGAEAKVDFGLNDKPATTPVAYATAAQIPAVLLGGKRFDGANTQEGEMDPPATQQQEAAVTGVMIAISGSRSFRLEFGQFTKALAQVRDCTNTLVESWGYDSKVQSSLQRPVTPVPSAAGWFRYEDYPESALRAGHVGMVRIRVDADAAGRVTRCHVIARTEPDEFADITCSGVLRRAKVKPALDAQGKPVPSFLVQRIRWTMG